MQEVIPPFFFFSAKLSVKCKDISTTYEGEAMCSNSRPDSWSEDDADNWLTGSLKKKVHFSMYLFIFSSYEERVEFL